MWLVVIKRNVSAEKHPTVLQVLSTQKSGIGCAEAEGSRGERNLGFVLVLRLEGKLKLRFHPFL